jgi:hypothetical protein
LGETHPIRPRLECRFKGVGRKRGDAQYFHKIIL